MTEQKVSEAELAQIRQMEEDLTYVTVRIGEISVQQVTLELEHKELIDTIKRIYQQREELVKSLQARFGTNGHVDLQSGLFVPEHSS